MLIGKKGLEKASTSNLSWLDSVQFDGECKGKESSRDAILLKIFWKNRTRNGWQNKKIIDNFAEDDKRT
jgi:hypothetical protein